MKTPICLVAVLMLYVAGCEKYVLSLNPLCPDEACVSVPGLEGKWASNDQVWTIRPTDTAAYELRVVDMLSAVSFTGRARRIGERWFLDLHPVRESEEMPVSSLFAAHWLQASSFMQVKLAGNTMSLMRMNAGELTKRLQEHPGLIKHMIRDDHVILVDETEALVKFVQAQAQVNELWKEQGEFIRCAPLYDAGDLIQPEGLAGCWFDPNESASGRIDIRAEGNHYSIEFTFESDEHLTFAAQVIKMRDLLLMGVFFGPEDMRSREMATRMPDWYAMIVLKKDRFDLTMLDFIEVKELLAHPEKAQDIQGEADARLIRVKP